jgi:hypothetical protein
MKYVLIIAILLFPVSLATAQQGPATRKHAQHERAARVESAKADTATKGATGQKFIDTDGDGICDKAVNSTGSTGQARCRNRGRDTFIDADGDGINDRRCGGLGPKLRGRRNTGTTK